MSTDKVIEGSAMPNSVTGNINPGEHPAYETGTNGTTAEKVALVVEHGVDFVDDHSVLGLTRLFNTATTQLSLVHLIVDTYANLPAQPTANMEMILSYTQERAQQQEESKLKLQELVSQAGFNIVDEQTFNLRDHNVKPVLDFVEHTGQQLLVLQNSFSSATATIRDHFFTSLTTHAPSPVLLLRRPLSPGREKLKVLFGVDESESTMRAARELGKLIHPAGIDLMLATVQSPVYQENAVLAPFVNQSVLDEALETNAKMIFEMVRDILETQGLTVQSSKRLIGSPSTELGYLAKQEEPDLVVLGSHNRKGFLAWVMGSVSSQLLHWDTHNLLVVR